MTNKSVPIIRPYYHTSLNYMSPVEYEAIIV